jgi:HEPN domain-containing protein
MTDIKDLRWPAIEVLAMACCIFRQKGFTATSSFVSEEQQQWTNKDMLTYSLIPKLASDKYILAFKPTDEDLETAEAIVKYYRRLSFGVIGDTINDYMASVFKNTQAEEVSMKDFGVIASIPGVYDKEITLKNLKAEIKDTVEGWIGKEGESIILNVRYIKTRYIPQINCYGHEAITDTNYLVSFLNKTELGKVGSSQKIRAKVKKHTSNFYTKTPETQLNYVKVLDTELIWQ